MRRLQIAEMDARYGEREVVHDVYLGLDDGEIGCLLGPSGCGKTTVLRAIAGFVPPSRGTITIRGTTVYDATPRFRQNNVTSAWFFRITPYSHI